MNEETVKQVLDDPLAQQLLASSIPARLAYTGKDGRPRAIPIGFHWDGSNFVVCTVPTSPKVRALAVRPDVALTIDTETFPPNVLLVRGRATSELVAGVPPEHLEASSTRKHRGKRCRPLSGGRSRKGCGRCTRR